jgi:hypothetical protein
MVGILNKTCKIVVGLMMIWLCILGILVNSTFAKADDFNLEKPVNLEDVNAQYNFTSYFKSFPATFNVAGKYELTYLQKDASISIPAPGNRLSFDLVYGEKSVLDGSVPLTFDFGGASTDYARFSGLTSDMTQGVALTNTGKIESDVDNLRLIFSNSQLTGVNPVCPIAHKTDGTCVGSKLASVATDYPFSDYTAEDDFYTQVKWAYQHGIITKASTFNPNSVTTKLQMMMFLYRLVKPTNVDAPSVSPFDGISSTDQGYDAVYWAYKMGIMTLGSDMKFDKTAQITRNQLALYFARIRTQNMNAGINSGNKFSDMDCGASYTVLDMDKSDNCKAINMLANEGIATAGGNYNGMNGLTRLQAMIFIYRFYNKSIEVL